LAIRQLDNLIDINKLPIPEAEKSDKENRAIGLGVMGFSDTIEQLGMSYDAEYTLGILLIEFLNSLATWQLMKAPVLLKFAAATKIS
jgi:ribonucleoside-diphosphate reductase alpha chain